MECFTETFCYNFEISCSPVVSVRKWRTDLCTIYVQGSRDPLLLLFSLLWAGQPAKPCRRKIIHGDRKLIHHSRLRTITSKYHLKHCPIIFTNICKPDAITIHNVQRELTKNPLSLSLNLKTQPGASLSLFKHYGFIRSNYNSSFNFLFTKPSFFLLRTSDVTPVAPQPLRGTFLSLIIPSIQ